MSAHGGAPALETAPLEHPSSRPSTPGLHDQHQQSPPASGSQRTSPGLTNPHLHTWRSLAPLQAGPWEAAHAAVEQPRPPPVPVATSATARAASTSTHGYPPPSRRVAAAIAASVRLACASLAANSAISASVAAILAISAARDAVEPSDEHDATVAEHDATIAANEATIAANQATIDELQAWCLDLAWP